MALNIVEGLRYAHLLSLRRTSLARLIPKDSPALHLKFFTVPYRIWTFHQIVINVSLFERTPHVVVFRQPAY